MPAEKVAFKSVPATEKREDPPGTKVAKGFGVRHTQALLLFVSLSIGFSMRAHLSVTMVAMTGRGAHPPNTCITHAPAPDDEHNATRFNGSSVVHENGALEDNFDICQRDKYLVNASSWNIYRTYDWPKSTQETILFAFFAGYTSMMLPMGLVAQKFGGKLPICAGLAANGLLSILTPWMPLFGGWVTVCVGRLLQGMTQAAFYPSVHTLLGKWAPLSERGRLSTYIYTGSQFGTILAFQIAGLLAGSPIFGWPSTFWFCGIGSLVCCVLLFYLGAASPNEHPTISEEELAYITMDGNADSTHKSRRTPWKHILRSKAVWGLVATHSGSAVGYLMLLTQIPMYMNKVLGVDIKRNGLYSSMPYIAMYIMALLFGYVSDLVANKKIMSVVNIRRVANTTGMVVSGAFMVGFCFVRSTLPALVLLVVCLGLHSGIHVGFHINHIDLAPNFAGPIMAIGNMIANLSGLIVPVLVSFIVGDDVTNQSKWQILFILIGLVQFITNFIFVVFVKSEVQTWNFYGGTDNGNLKEKIYAVKKIENAFVTEKEKQTLLK